MSIRQKMIMMMECTKLHKHFQEYFRIVPALTPELTDEAYRVRHQVYCEELGWEPVREDGMEKDEYDDRSVHCLLQCVHTNNYIGCVRLVMAAHDNPMIEYPFQDSCRDVLEPGYPDPKIQQRGVIAEVSRLAVIKKYRRRRHEANRSIKVSDSDFGSIRQPRFPFIPVGLYLGMSAMAHQMGIEKLYFLTEPSLAKHFTKMGGRLKPIGGAVNHRGERVPYEVDVKEIRSKINLLLRPLNKVIVREVEAGFAAHADHKRRA